MLLYGSRLWPGIFVGAFVVNLLVAGSTFSSLVIAAGNTAEVVLASYLIARFAGGRNAFDRPEDALKFSGLAALAAMVSPTIGVTTLAVGDPAIWRDSGYIWLTWWQGDVAGALVVAPFLILWALAPHPSFTRRQGMEIRIVLTLLVLLSLAVFGGLLPTGVKRYPLAFLCVPILVWTAVRFTPRETATALLLLSALAVWGTLHHFGPFVADSTNDSLLLLQSFMAVMAVMALALTAGICAKRREEARLLHTQRELDLRVQERTAELTHLNLTLYAEITEHRRTEERLKRSAHLLAQAEQVAGMGGWLWDIPTNTVTWSDQLYRIYGIQDEDFSASFEGYLDRVHPEDRELAQRTVQKALNDHQPFEFDQRIVLPDGTVRFLHARGEVILNEQGQPVQMIGVNQDMTKQHELEEQLLHAQKMDAIGQLAGGIAHDFNNMMMAVRGFSDLLLLDLPPDAKLRGHVEDIQAATDQAVALTRQLLAFARRQVLQPRVLDLNIHLTQIAQVVGRLIGEDIKLSLVLDPKLGRVKVDPVQLDQVVINLALNARDAMPQGGRLRIRTTNVLMGNGETGSTGSPDPYVALVVTDTGCGMAENTQERIFEPFFTTKPQGKGTGLGLSTVYGIVKQSGGHISVESQPGRGTTFTIYFPQVREELPVSGPQLVTGDGCRGSETILVVEDETVVERFICEALRSYGYTVLSARRGDEALALARSHHGPINLLLTDVVMPGMNGVETARQLRTLRHDIKVVLMSGYADTPSIRNGALTEGRFLQKPILAPVLARTIRDELDGVATK